MQSVTLTLSWALAAGNNEIALVLEALAGFDEGLLKRIVIPDAAAEGHPGRAAIRDPR